MAARGLLITGTDTGVGKTFVGCGLAAALHRRGLRVAPFKPVETGCELDPETQTPQPLDALLLRQATQTNAPMETICPYRLREPVAPWVAAEREGVQIDPTRLENCYQQLTASHDCVLVETAGGILVPLTQSFHFGDLARLLKLPVLLVAGSRLGVINQTLLTIAYLEKTALPVLACILNRQDDQTGPAIETNAATLRRLLRYSLYEVPYDPTRQQSSVHPIFDELAERLIA